SCGSGLWPSGQSPWSSRCCSSSAPSPWSSGCSLATRGSDDVPRAVPMKAPLSWLREFVDVDLTPEQIAERLTLLGMEVKGIVRWGDDWRNVVVGELLSVERHPRADRLS